MKGQSDHIPKKPPKKFRSKSKDSTKSSRKCPLEKAAKKSSAVAATAPKKFYNSKKSWENNDDEYADLIMEEAQCNATYNFTEDDDAQLLEKKDTDNLTQNKYNKFELDNKDAILAADPSDLFVQPGER